MEGKGMRSCAFRLASLLLAAFMLCTAASAAELSADRLMPVGHTVGLRLDVDGVIVVGLREENGVCAAREAGIREGDVIRAVNKTELRSAAQFMQLAENAAGEKLSLTVVRGDEVLEMSVDTDAGLGLWVRDSVAGIGTVTFYDEESGVFGMLGHGINDEETGRLIPLRSGAVMYSVVSGVTRGESGSPGELHGSFSFAEEMGELVSNTDGGVFGTLDDCAFAETVSEIEVAQAGQLHTGDAVILANVEGDHVEEFAVRIVRVYPQPLDSLRSMVIEVADERLIELTGGIVQGMSGSPIIQDGKLVGAVTHVLVNDPTRGYGIFIENMLEAAS